MAEHQRIEVGLLVTGGNGEIAITVTADTDATVAQLQTAIAGRAGLSDETGGPWRLVRTGEILEPDQLVGSLQLRHGDRLVAGAMDDPPNPSQPVSWRLRVVGGPDAGRSFPLPPGQTTVGGSDRADIQLPDRSLSSIQATFDVRRDGVFVADAGSTNGTLVDRQAIGERGVPFERDALAELGGCLLAVEPAPADTTQHRPPYRAGELLFNRPLRPVTVDEEPVVEIPSPPDIRTRRRVPLATALIPLVLAVVIAVAVGNALFLLIALLAPAVAAVSVVTDRRAGRSAQMKAIADYEAKLQRANDLAAELLSRSAVARRKASPDPAELVDRAERADPWLWERRSTDEDFLALRVGMADRPTRVRFEGEDPAGEEADLFRQTHADDVDVPATVDLRRGSLGVTGPEAAREAIARALILQAVCLHSPRDVAIVALVPNRALERWRFLQWLPHTETLVPGTRTVAAEKEDCQALLATIEDVVAARRVAAGLPAQPDADLPAEPAADARDPHVLLLVAGDVPVPASGLSRVLRAGAAVGVTAVVLADANQPLPDECAFVASFAGGLSVLEGELALVARATGHVVQPVIPDLTPEAVLTDVAFALAPLRDIAAQAQGGPSDLPSDAPLLELVDLTDPDGKAIAARWTQSTAGLAAAIGVTADAHQVIDLRRDGPHALVAGATGAGKTELLQAWVASLASAYPPDRLTFMLIDHEGGTAFQDCARLPHVIGLFSELDEGEASQALESLETELRRREESAGGPHDPASLVIVVDEYSLLKKEAPEFADGVAEIAQRGGALGVHLVLATERPTGVVNDELPVDIGLRIALRVDDDVDSTQVLGRPDAAHIPRQLPGRAYLRVGGDGEEVTPVQMASVSARRPTGPPGDGRPRVDAALFPFSPMPWHLADAPPAAQAQAGELTDLQRIVAAIIEAAKLGSEVG
jgi:DNA segregation ATPase FtsK/SpoIIIE, S-DNA-T family